MSDLWPNVEGWNLSYAGDIFGALYGGGSVKQAAISTLELWLPTYIAEVNRQLGRTVLFVPKDYLYQADERAVTPGTSQVSVHVPSTVGVPERTRDGTRAVWQLLVGLYFAGTQDWNQSEAIAWAYEAAARPAIGQHASLGNFAETTVWTGSALGRRQRVSTIWNTSVTTTFHVAVHNVMIPYGGPSEPSVLPPAAPVTVTAEEIIVQQQS